MNDYYRTIESASDGFFKDRGSKFYAFAIPVLTEEEFKTHYDRIKKEYHDARHHVYAFMLGHDQSFFRASDDGEPANSSGAPVLGQIRSFELTNLAIIVVRYFGGTKLGIPGLINAYKTAAASALRGAKVIRKRIQAQIRICFSYPDMEMVNRLIREEALEVVHRDFALDCRMTLAVPLSKTANIQKRLADSHHIQIITDNGKTE